MEKDFKTSEAQRKANQKWREKNKKKNRYSNYKSSAKLFAREYAKSLEDIKELEEIFKKENKNFKGKTENML